MLFGRDYNKVGILCFMSEKKLNFLIVFFAVLIAGLIWLFVFSKKTIPISYKPFATPIQLSELPSVFKDWPIEKDNLLNSFYTVSPGLNDKLYTAVYQTSKSINEAADVYRGYLKERGVDFQESEGLSSYFDAPSKILQIVSLPGNNDQVAIIIRKGKEENQNLVTLIYTKHEK